MHVTCMHKRYQGNMIYIMPLVEENKMESGWMGGRDDGQPEESYIFC